jgi:hypothetical protein
MQHVSRLELHDKNCPVWNKGEKGLRPDLCNCEPIVKEDRPTVVISSDGDERAEATPRVFYGLREPAECN